MFQKSLKVLIIIFFVVFSFNLASSQVLAQSDTGFLPDTESGKGECPPDYEGDCGKYSLNDMVSVFIKLSEWILGIVGSLALLMFVYGGFTWILSAGSPDKVQKGKSILIGAVVGLVIIFSSYLIIQFTMESLGIEGEWQTAGQLE